LTFFTQNGLKSQIPFFKILPILLIFLIFFS